MFECKVIRRSFYLISMLKAEGLAMYIPACTIALSVVIKLFLDAITLIEHNNRSY